MNDANTNTNVSATDSNASDIFSLRIVSIDNYMRAPVLGLDTCYSEFRAEAVKQVPVIRVFGTDTNGTKTCAHIHGVFPYLYVPYAGGDAANDADRLTYQLATSLDKAINISLGQANSATQHVFKIVLVKAKPFYGYHRAEHQFLKIFLYNPAFIRRAANLLQNGVILGKIYQPHESHVPYILQFMIDFNLYGMSFLYTPLKLVRYRQPTIVVSSVGGDNQQQSSDDLSQNDGNFSNDEVLKNVNPSQILERSIERMSTSKQEVDLNAATILNRFQVAMNDTESEYANPGIAFLWSDERTRRNKLQEDPPSVTKTQDRGKLPPTDSEMFHQAALNRRLEQLAAISDDDTLTPSSDHSRLLDQTIVNRKFDLNQFLQNSVYPSECTQIDEKHPSSNQSILDASFLIDHTQPGRSSALSSRLDSTHSPSVHSGSSGSQQFDPNETFVDEDLILSLSQRSQLNKTLTNETLNENEHEVLDIFELLEQQEEEEASILDETMRIDDDSTLAPLSQPQQRTNEITYLSQKSDLKREIAAFEGEDSDDDLLNQFSMSIIDYLPDESKSDDGSDDLKVPQLDGAFDTPTEKHAIQRGKLKTYPRSPSKSSSKKYAPLDIVITKSPAVQRDAMTVNQQKIPLKVPKLCLEKCDANISTKVLMVHQPPTTATNTLANDSPVCPNNNCIDLTTDEDKPAKVDQPAVNSSDIKVPKQYEHILQKPAFVKLIKYDNIEKELKTSGTQAHSKRQSLANNADYIDDSDTSSFESVTEPSESAVRRYPLRERKPRSDLQSFLTEHTPGAESKRKKPSTKNNEDLDKLDALYSWYKWSDCKLAKRYDKVRNFFPQPGPSNLNYYEDDDIVGYYQPVSDEKSKKKGVTRSNSLAASKKATTETAENKPTTPKTRSQKRKNPQEESPIPKEFSWHSDNSDWEDDIQIQSIYEQSFAESLNVTARNSPNAIPPTPPTPSSNQCEGNGSDTKKTPKNTVSFLDQTIPTPVLSKFMENLKTAASNEANETYNGDELMKSQQIRIVGQCKITPLEIAPHHSDIVNALDTHEIPKMTHPIPHYSDPNDVLADNSKKEVGHTILQLHGNAINDCEEFQSELNVSGLAKWQRYIVSPNCTLRATRNNNGKAIENAGKCRKFFAREQLTKITPSEIAPTHEQTIEWLKERTTNNNNSKKRSSTLINDDNDDVENPAKIPRQNSVLNQINNNNQQKHSNDLKQNGNQEGDIVSKLLAKTELTVTRVTRSNSSKKNQISQSTDANYEQKINNNNYKNQNDDDGDDNDVIILSDNLTLSTKQQPANNSFSQVGRPRRIHLK